MSRTSRFPATVASRARRRDLIHLYLADPDRWLTVSRSKRVLEGPRRYRGMALNATIPKLLDAMESARLIEVVTGKRGKDSDTQTILRAGPELLVLIDTFMPTPPDLHREPDPELIILKEKRPERIAGTRGSRPAADLVDYADTDVIVKMREEIRALNEWLAGADIAFIDDGLVPKVDPSHRHLRRYFNNGSFAEGGRIFPGTAFWLNLSKDRRHGLRIGGEEVVGADWSSTFLRLLYAEYNKQAPLKDLYVIPGLGPRYRDGVKRVLASLLFREGPLERLPQGSRSLLPPGTTAFRIEGAVRRAHPIVASSFGTGAGFRLMRKESNLLLLLLGECRRQGIIALPLHDAVLVQRSRGEEVREIMLEVFRTNVGFETIVTLKTVSTAGADTFFDESPE